MLRTRVSLALAGLSVVTGLTVVLARPVTSQVQGVLPAFVRLQESTPGVSQAGHSNITGTAKAGQFQGGGSALTGLNASQVTTGTLPDGRLSGNVALLSGNQTFGGLVTFGGGLNLPTGAGVGKVMTSDASGNASWQSLGGFALPFTGSSNHPSGAVFDVTNSSTSTGWGLRGASAGNGSGVFGTSLTGYGVYGMATHATSQYATGVFGQSASNNNGRGVVGYSTALSGANFGVVGQSDSTGGAGVFGYVGAGTGSSGVLGQSDGANGVGVRGIANNGFSSSGVWGQSSMGFGVYGVTSGERSGVFGDGGLYGNGVFGETVATGKAAIFGRSLGTEGIGVIGTGDANGVAGESFSGDGVLGITYGAISAGVTGISHGGVASSGVYGESSTGYGVQGLSGASNGQGVYGAAFGVGVFGSGLSTTSYGVHGRVGSGTGNAGVIGQSYATNGNGVIGEATSGTSAYGVWAKAPQGTGVYCQGALVVTGSKSFRIDHPADPENKYLVHYCSEGPEPLNVYGGNVVTDAQGFATVALPGYFEQINRDFRYQLTVLDASDEFVLAKVVRGVQNNAFVIRTSRPRVAVSWEVKGVRNDLYTKRYGAAVEVEKTEKDRGTYQHPELYGKPESLGFAPVRQAGQEHHKRTPGAVPGP